MESNPHRGSRLASRESGHGIGSSQIQQYGRSVLEKSGAVGSPFQAVQLVPIVDLKRETGMQNAATGQRAIPENGGVQPGAKMFQRGVRAVQVPVDPWNDAELIMRQAMKEKPRVSPFASKKQSPRQSQVQYSLSQASEVAPSVVDMLGVAIQAVNTREMHITRLAASCRTFAVAQQDAANSVAFPSSSAQLKRNFADIRRAVEVVVEDVREASMQVVEAIAAWQWEQAQKAVAAHVARPGSPIRYPSPSPADLPLPVFHWAGAEYLMLMIVDVDSILTSSAVPTREWIGVSAAGNPLLAPDSLLTDKARVPVDQVAMARVVTSRPGMSRPGSPAPVPSPSPHLLLPDALFSSMNLGPTGGRPGVAIPRLALSHAEPAAPSGGGAGEVRTASPSPSRHLDARAVGRILAAHEHIRRAVGQACSRMIEAQRRAAAAVGLGMGVSGVAVVTVPPPRYSPHFYDHPVLLEPSAVSARASTSPTPAKQPLPWENPSISTGSGVPSPVRLLAPPNTISALPIAARIAELRSGLRTPPLSACKEERREYYLRLLGVEVEAGSQVGWGPAAYSSAAAIEGHAASLERFLDGAVEALDLGLGKIEVEGGYVNVPSRTLSSSSIGKGAETKASPRPNPTTAETKASPRPNPTTAETKASPRPNPTTAETKASPRPNPTTAETKTSPRPNPTVETKADPGRAFLGMQRLVRGLLAKKRTLGLRRMRTLVSKVSSLSLSCTPARVTALVCALRAAQAQEAGRVGDTGVPCSDGGEAVRPLAAVCRALLLILAPASWRVKGLPATMRVYSEPVHASECVAVGGGRGTSDLHLPLSGSHSLDVSSLLPTTPASALVAAVASLPMRMPLDMLADVCGADGGEWLSSRLHTLNREVLQPAQGLLLSPPAVIAAGACLSDPAVVALPSALAAAGKGGVDGTGTSSVATLLAACTSPSARQAILILQTWASIVCRIVELTSACAPADFALSVMARLAKQEETEVGGESLSSKPLPLLSGLAPSLSRMYIVVCAHDVPLRVCRQVAAALTAAHVEGSAPMLSLLDVDAGWASDRTITAAFAPLPTAQSSSLKPAGPGSTRPTRSVRRVSIAAGSDSAVAAGVTCASVGFHKKLTSRVLSAAVGGRSVIIRVCTGAGSTQRERAVRALAGLMAQCRKVVDPRIVWLGGGFTFSSTSEEPSLAPATLPLPPRFAVPLDPCLANMSTRTACADTLLLHECTSLTAAHVVPLPGPDPLHPGRLPSDDVGASIASTALHGAGLAAVLPHPMLMACIEAWCGHGAHVSHAIVKAHAKSAAAPVLSSDGDGVDMTPVDDDDEPLIDDDEDEAIEAAIAEGASNGMVHSRSRRQQVASSSFGPRLEVGILRVEDDLHAAARTGSVTDALSLACLHRSALIAAALAACTSPIHVGEEGEVAAAAVREERQEGGPALTLTLAPIDAALRACAGVSLRAAVGALGEGGGGGGVSPVQVAAGGSVYTPGLDLAAFAGRAPPEGDMLALACVFVGLMSSAGSPPNARRGSEVGGGVPLASLHGKSVTVPVVWELARRLFMLPPPRLARRLSSSLPILTASAPIVCAKLSLWCTDLALPWSTACAGTCPLRPSPFSRSRPSHATSAQLCAGSPVATLLAHWCTAVVAHLAAVCAQGGVGVRLPLIQPGGRGMGGEALIHVGSTASGAAHGVRVRGEGDTAAGAGGRRRSLVPIPRVAPSPPLPLPWEAYVGGALAHVRERGAGGIEALLHAGEAVACGWQEAGDACNAVMVSRTWSRVGADTALPLPVRWTWGAGTGEAEAMALVTACTLNLSVPAMVRVYSHPIRPHTLVLAASAVCCEGVGEEGERGAQASPGSSSVGVGPFAVTRWMSVSVPGEEELAGQVGVVRAGCSMSVPLPAQAMELALAACAGTLPPSATPALMAILTRPLLYPGASLSYQQHKA